MTRLLTVLHNDLRLHFRYGFYYAAGFVTVMWIGLLTPLAGEIRLPALIAAMFVELGIVGFYFIAGNILFEKSERTVYALVVTPLRFGEYLVSKLVTLTLMALVVSLVVILAIHGTGFQVLPLLAGLLVLSLVGLLAGFITVAPFTSISAFFLPSQLVIIIVTLPLLGYIFGIDSLLFTLMPTHSALQLVRAAFGQITLSLGEAGFSLAYSLVWIAALVWVSRAAFSRFILRREGER